MRTEDFVRELAALNHHFTLWQANQWVEYYPSSFSDISTEEGEERTFHMFTAYGNF